MKEIKYTDSLLACIFADVKHKEYAIHLYNDLLKTEYTDSRGLMMDMEKEGIYLNQENRAVIVLAYNIAHEEFKEKFDSEEVYEYRWCVDRLNRSIAEGVYPRKAVKELLEDMPDDFVIKQSLLHKKKRLENIVREEIAAEEIIRSESE